MAPGWFAALAIVLSAGPSCTWAELAGRNKTRGPEESARRSTAELVRSRGFLAEQHHVVTPDGYILSLVKCNNPLINRGRSGLRAKTPLLLLHGTLTSADCFVNNNRAIRPKNLSRHNVSRLGVAGLRRLLAGEPNVKSLPFLAMSFGHEVWLLNRRGTPESLGRRDGRNGTLEGPADGGPERADRLLAALKADLEAAKGEQDGETLLGSLAELFGRLMGNATSEQDAASNFWSFSMDEQAAYDLPAVLRYIRRRTGRSKVSIVGHSVGGAIPLMALALRPALASRIDRAVLWAPAVNLGHTIREKFVLPLTKLLEHYDGAFPPLSLMPKLVDLLADICSTKTTQNSVCRLGTELAFGEAAEQGIDPSQIQNFLNSVSARELLQLGQNEAFGGRQHLFRFGERAQNVATYGQAEPPAYNFSAIALRSICLMAGKTDGLVAPRDVELTAALMSVPVHFELVEGHDGRFNHISFLVDELVGPMVNVPTLVELSPAELSAGGG